MPGSAQHMAGFVIYKFSKDFMMLISSILTLQGKLNFIPPSDVPKWYYRHTCEWNGVIVTSCSFDLWIFIGLSILSLWAYTFKCIWLSSLDSQGHRETWTCICMESHVYIPQVDWGVVFLHSSAVFAHTFIISIFRPSEEVSCPPVWLGYSFQVTLIQISIRQDWEYQVRLSDS